MGVTLGCVARGHVQPTLTAAGAARPHSGGSVPCPSACDKRRDVRTIDEVPDELALMFQEAAGTGSFTLSPRCIKTSSHFAFGGKLSQVLSRAYGAFCCFSSALVGVPADLAPSPPGRSGEPVRSAGGRLRLFHRSLCLNTGGGLGEPQASPFLYSLWAPPSLKQ